MNTKSIATIAAIALLPIAGFAQTPPAPPASPIPPDRHEKMPKVPVTFLGVETSEVPNVVSEQLGLAKGFGLVVDYIVPDGPAAAAGVQQNDILKMLNDQILTEPDQLAKLVRSYSEGTNVTLTVLRKGQEQKITVKLTKKEVPQHEMGPGRHRHSDFRFGGMDFGDFGMNGDFKEQMENLKEQLGDQTGMIHDAVVKAREEAMRARDQAREQTRRAVEETRRAAGRWNITTNEDGGLKTTKIDIDKAQIVFSDDKGEMKLETVDGKKLLTAKDPQGKLLFSGPVETKEDLDKIPAEVRQRYDKLQQEELRSVAPPSDTNEDDDSADTSDDDDETSPMEQVSNNSYPRTIWIYYGQGPTLAVPLSPPV
jgi:serine protease Do